MRFTHLLQLPDGKSIGLLNEAEAAQYLAVAPQTLSNWRSQGIGPVHVCVGKRRIAYRLQDLERWVEQNAVEPQRRSS